MAVWLQIIGKRNTTSLEDERRKIFGILSNINLDLSFLENTEFISNYNSKKWRLEKKYNMEYFEYPLVDDSDTRFRSIRVIFNNPNFLEFSGPFEFFSEWYLLGKTFPEKITDGWRKVFAEISKKYEMDQLLYFSEWFYATEDIHSGEEPVEDLFERFNMFGAIEVKSLAELNHNAFFIDKLI